MNKWQVILTPEFRTEIRDIHSYIANTLLVPDIALNQVRRIIERVDDLASMPFRYALYDKEPWRGRGLRKVTIDNYTMFYLPNENTKEVIIFHVFYGKRNIEEILKD